MSLKGKTAIVTGASRGIGQSIALELAARGASVAVNYVALEEQNESDAMSVSRECASLGGESIVVEADISSFSACEKMIAEVTGKLGGVDILVNNAGILRDRTLAKMTVDEWQSVLNVNLTGTFNVTKSALAALIADGWGRVVSLSSIIGVTGGFGQTNYSASKAGIIGFTKSLAREVASKGVTVNAVAPGLVDTGILGDIPENVMAGYLQKIPVGRLAKPEEIAKLVGFLCSTDADYITGQVIGINGGWLM